MVKIKGPVDLTSQQLAQQYHVFNTEGGTLEPGYFYLGVSRERFTLPRNVYGLINTRSKYARRGLELARSSTFVIPGFGMAEPSPLVFEITVPYAVNGLTSNEPYGFLLLFETDFEVPAEVGSYSDRFPMNLLGPE
jgi:deoxycytidine triphosphate deaminase